MMEFATGKWLHVAPSWPTLLAVDYVELKPRRKLAKALGRVSKGVIVLRAAGRAQRDIEGEFSQVNAEDIHVQPPFGVMGRRKRVGGKTLLVRPGRIGGEWILHSLDEHACWRIRPISRTALLGTGHSRHLMRQRADHTSSTR